MNRAQRRLGVAIVVCYVVVALLTARWSGRPTLPLFEGVGPVPSYQWVNPPAEFASGNIRPKPTTQRIALTTSGNASVGVTSTDGQFVLQLPAGAIPGRVGSKTAVAVITPLDPAKLAPLPDGLNANGNAYQLAISYVDGPRLTKLAKTSSLVMYLPHLAFGPIFNAAASRTWTALPGHASHTTTMGTQFGSLGRFVASTDREPGAGGASEVSVGVVVAVFAVAAVIVGIVVVIVVRRRNAPLSRAERRRRARRG